MAPKLNIFFLISVLIISSAKLTKFINSLPGDRLKYTVKSPIVRNPVLSDDQRFSAARSLALRERGFRSVSSADGTIALRTTSSQGVRGRP